MPPEENQGNPPVQPSPSGPTPQQPTTQSEPQTANPNLNPVADPAPVTTTEPSTPSNPSSVSPAGPAPTAGAPTTPIPPSPAPVAPSAPKKLIGIIVAAILLLMAALFLLPFSPLSIFASKGTTLTVGENRYVHACSVFDMETIAKELGLNADKSKQGVEESFSADPIGKQKSIDLIKHTGESSINSSCKIKFDRKVTTGSDGIKTPSFINVSLFVQQYPTEKDATDKFNSSKEEAGSAGKTLASYKDSSLYLDPAPGEDGGPSYVQPVVRHKNLLIYFTAPLKSDDQEGTKMVAQLDKVAKDTIRRIDAKEGDKSKSLSGITKLGDNNFVDVCHSTDFAAFGKAIDPSIEFEPTGFSAMQHYAEDDSSGQSPKYLLSSCTFDFRTKTEWDSLAQKKSDESSKNKDENAESTYKSEYPHFVFIQILANENKEASQKIVDTFKETGEKQQLPEGTKLEEAKLGDKALKLTTSSSKDSPYENQLFYVAKDSYTYLISVSFKRQSEPFKTTDQTVSDEQAKKLLDVLVKATAKAN